MISLCLICTDKTDMYICRAYTRSQYGLCTGLQHRYAVHRQHASYYMYPEKLFYLLKNVLIVTLKTKTPSLTSHGNTMDSLTSTSLMRFPFSSVPSSFLIAFFKSLLVANSKVLRSQKQATLEWKKRTNRQNKTYSDTKSLALFCPAVERPVYCALVPLNWKAWLNSTLDSLHDYTDTLNVLFCKNYNTDFIKLNIDWPIEANTMNKNPAPVTRVTINLTLSTFETMSRVLKPYNICVAHKPTTMLQHLLTNINPSTPGAFAENAFSGNFGGF